MRRVLLGCFFLFGFDGLSQDSQTVYEEYKVSIHQLHVHVTDKDGKAVKDLKPEDFTVKLNGMAQPIQSVQHISLLQDVLEADEEELAANPIPENGRRLFLFLFDLRYNSRRGLHYAREAANSFVENDMLETDLAAVFTLGDSLNMAINFTNDPDQLLFAINTMGFAGERAFNNRSGYASASIIRNWAQNRYNQEDKLSLDELDSLLGEEFRESFEAVEASEQRRNALRGSKYLARFKELGSVLQVLKGRKNILFFSEGMNEDSIFGANSTAWNLRYMSDVVESLSGGGTVVYAVDTSRQDLSQFKSGMTMLNNIAASSGGRVYSNYNKYKAPLQKVEAHTSNYYLVGIQSELELPVGELARVKVDINRPGLKIDAPKGLLLSPDFKETSALERKLLLSEFIAKDQIALPIPISTRVVQAPGVDALGRLNIMAQIHKDYFLGAPGKTHKLEVFTLAIHKESRQLAAESYQDLTLSPKATASQANIRYFSVMELAPGPYKIKTIVRNLENGQIACMIDDVTVESGQLLASSPTLMDREPVVLIRPNQEQTGGRLYSLSGQKLCPTPSNNIPPGEKASLMYSIDPNQLKGREHAISVAAMVVDENGVMSLAPPEAIQSEVSLPKNGKQTATFILTLDMSAFKLKEDVSYQLLTRLTVGDLEPVRSEFDFLAYRL